MARWYDKYNPSGQDQFDKLKADFFQKNIWSMRALFLLHILSFMALIYLWGKYVY